MITWVRKDLKDLAKAELKTSYWTSFLVCLVGGILGGSGVGSGGFGGSFGGSLGSSTGSSGEYSDIDPEVLVLILFGVLIFMLVIIAFSIFVSNVVSVGISSYFVQAPYGRREFGTLFSAFKGGRYWPTVKAMFLTSLYIGLWSLITCGIMGIVKRYQYRMVPYLIAENPYLTPKECMDYSKEMTMGHKMDMWVLDLSFIGWHLLGMLACCIGGLFVTPYVEATWAQLYYVLRGQIQVRPPEPPAQPGYNY